MQVNFPGNQTRSFMYISDLVDGMIKLMESNFTKPINLVGKGLRVGRGWDLQAMDRQLILFGCGLCCQGNPDEYTILEFANIISTLTGEHCLC